MIKWDELNWKEFEKLVPLEYNTCLFPVGTLEAHGYTNLGTDNSIPWGICERIADKIHAIVAPLLPYGITKSLLQYPGSMTISPGVYKELLVDLFESISAAGFDRLVVMNGHGGNNSQLKEAAFDVSTATGMKILVIHWWDLVSDVVKEVYGERGGHAALDETAALMAVRPDLLRKDDYRDEDVYLFNPGAYVIPNPSATIIYNKGEGYLNFDQEKANQYFDIVCERILAFIEDIFARWEKNP
ncbi:MAG: creatininase family protein [candidate division Zixibacteria bacterium]|nr:creatininase family protein [candidate division Zixibacteria bacterium]